MGKICCIFNIPSLYREAIYLDIDQRYDCEWYFEQEENGISLFDINKLKSAHILKHGKFINRFYRMKGLISRLLNREDIDNYLMFGSPLCISIWVLCILLKIFHPQKKIYFWTHGWYGKETTAEYYIKKTFLKLADELFLYGNYAKDLLIKEGFNADKMHVIYNSLSYDVQMKLRKQIQPSDVYRKYFGNGNPVIIFIGRLTPIKKLEMLVDAISIMKKNGNEINLVFVGDGSERMRLESKVNSLNIEEQVCFIGACYDEKVNAELVYNADLCVAPGNIGLTAMHVMMFGCPAITHNRFAYQMPEFEAIKPFKTGNFFERGNVESMVKVINEWFVINGNHRDNVREECYKEIDEHWNPYFQMEVIKKVFG